MGKALLVTCESYLLTNIIKQYFSLKVEREIMIFAIRAHVH